MFNGIEIFQSTNGYSPISSSSDRHQDNYNYHINIFHQQQSPPPPQARQVSSVAAGASSRSISYQNMEPTASSSLASTTTALATISSSSSSTVPNQYHAQHATNHNQYGFSSNLRYEQFTRHNTRASSLNAIGDSMSEIILDENNEPTSAILEFCKKRFLQPYVTILGLIGLNPIPTDSTVCKTFLHFLYSFVIFIVISMSYLMMYLVSYRFDRGLQSRKYEQLPFFYTGMSELVFAYSLPVILNLTGFVTAVVVFKIIENEHLQNISERTFLMTSSPRRLCCILWTYIFIGATWVFLQVMFILYQLSIEENIQIKNVFGSFQDMEEQWIFKAILIATMFIQNTVQVTILLTYSMFCILLRVHLTSLTGRLIQHSIENVDWMKEILECRKILMHVNNRIAIPVSFLAVTNLSYGFAALTYLFKEYDFRDSASKDNLLHIANILLCFSIGTFPFFQAGLVTSACKTVKDNGHQIRVRPFVYNNTNTDDLNSTLLFASTLNMSAKLFGMPIQTNYLAFIMLSIFIATLTLGMSVILF